MNSALRQIYINEAVVASGKVVWGERSYSVIGDMPHDLDIERKVVGMVLALVATGMNLDVIRRIDYLRPEVFYSIKYGFVFHAVKEAIEQKRPNYEQVRANLQAHKNTSGSRFDYIGGEGALLELSNINPNVETIVVCSQQIVSFATRRAVIASSHIVSTMARENPYGDTLGLLNEFQRQINHMQMAVTQATHNNTVTLSEMANGYIERIIAEVKDPNHQVGIPIWIKGLQDKLLGWRKSKLYVIAAGTGMGKTFFGLNVALFCLRTQQKLAYVSLEMNEPEIMERLLPMEAEISGKRFQSRNLDDHELYALKGASDRIKGYGNQMSFTSLSMPTMSEVRGKMEEIYLTMSPDMIVIDYAGIETLAKSHTKLTDTEHANEIWAGMKEISDKYNCPVVVFAQVNRDYLSNKDKRPDRGDVANSAAAERGADVLMIVHRPAELGMVDYPVDYADITIVKNRNAESGRVAMKFDLRTGWFTEWTDVLPNGEL